MSSVLESDGHRRPRRTTRRMPTSKRSLVRDTHRCMPACDPLRLDDGWIAPSPEGRRAPSHARFQPGRRPSRPLQRMPILKPESKAMRRYRRGKRGDNRGSRRRAESDSAITRPRKPNPVCQRLSPCAATKLSCTYIGWDADHDVSVISGERCANGVAYGGAWRDAAHACSAPITYDSPTLRGSYRGAWSVMHRRRPRHQARGGVSMSAW